jgi:VIT1/CCC1 family predicted Fe2+/Mn2+ transporter
MDSHVELRMTTHQQSTNPPLGIGLASVILGSVGGLLFFLPVLGIPLGMVGLALGLVGLLLAILGRASSLRWSVAGVLVSGMALGTGVLIGMAPAGYLQNPSPPAIWQNVADHPYVPPPARPGI